MNVVIFPEMLTRIAKLPSARLEGEGGTVPEGEGDFYYYK